MGMAGLRAAGHGEIEVGADRLAAPVIAGRDGADQGGGVEDMVVEREVVRRQDVGTERLLPRPVGDEQAGGGGLQVGERGFAGPAGFKGEFESAAGSDAESGGGAGGGGVS